MKGAETVSQRQMAALLLVFTTGSTIIFIPSSLLSESGNAFWLAWIFAGAYGLFILLCMLFLQRRFPGGTLIEAGKQTLGAGTMVALMLPYLAFALLLLAYIYYSVGIFFTTTMMKDTPMIVFNGLTALACAVTAYSGINAMARMFILLAAVLIGSIVLVLLLGLPNYHPEFLLPVMPYGIRPVFHSTYQLGGFQYGDFIVFAMLFGCVRAQKNGNTVRQRPLLLAFTANWTLMVVANFCIIMTLGPMTNEIKYPMFSVARLISIQEIIERGESVIGMSLLVGSYMKSTITLYAANLAISRLLKIENERLLLFPIALLGLMLSLIIVRDEFQYVVVLLLWPLVTTAATLPLLIIAIVALFKRPVHKPSS